MSDPNSRKQDAEKHLQHVRNEAEKEAPEADEEGAGDRARHMTPGVGWTRGKDVEDAGSQKKAPHDPHTQLDRTGEKKYERAAKDFARREKK